MVRGTENLSALFVLFIPPHLLRTHFCVGILIIFLFGNTCSGKEPYLVWNVLQSKVSHDLGPAKGTTSSTLRFYTLSTEPDSNQALFASLKGAHLMWKAPQRSLCQANRRSVRGWLEIFSLDASRQHLGRAGSSQKAFTYSVISCAYHGRQSRILVINVHAAHYGCNNETFDIILKGHPCRH
jgi:hypothetical protein